MDMYNATIELAVRNRTTKKIDQFLNAFADYDPTITTSDLGRLELTLSLPAESLWQATTVRGLTANLKVTRVSVETSDDFDARSDGNTEVHLLSVREAAVHLGITRAGVQRRIETGRMHPVRVGSVWAIPTATVRTAATHSTRQ